MPITGYLVNNAKNFKDDIALVEINPEVEEKSRMTWREYSLIEPSNTNSLRKEMTWGEFDKKANRFCNLLLSRGIKKGDRVAILLMNSLEWLPVYFGILKAGCLAVPLNFRYSGEEIKYCLDLADCEVLVFGPEFTERVDSVLPELTMVKTMLFVGIYLECLGLSCGGVCDCLLGQGSGTQIKIMGGQS